eukprot:Platyproteum_vivax@DN318_c0_g1_i1.p1
MTVEPNIDIKNLGGAPTDPFSKGGEKAGGDYIHIRNQQRNGKKSLTTIQGIDDKYDLKRMLKQWKKEFSCNGTLLEDDEGNMTVVQVSGDQRESIRTWLIREGISEKEHVKVHGAYR